MKQLLNLHCVGYASGKREVGSSVLKRHLSYHGIVEMFGDFEGKVSCLVRGMGLY